MTFLTWWIGIVLIVSLFGNGTTTGKGARGRARVKSMGIFSFEALKVTQLLLALIYLYYTNVISVPLLSPLSLK